LLRRCLEKDPSRRLRDAADVRIAIEDVLHEPLPLAATPVRQHKARLGWLPAMAIGTLIALAAGLAGWMLKPGSIPGASPVARLSVGLPPGDTIGLTWPAIALSADGRLLAYTATRGSNASQLFVRPIGSLEVRLVPGSEGAKSPFFSPD
jgi:hypothetical protein